MIVFMYLMGAMLMSQHLCHVEAEKKNKSAALWATYFVMVVFWPFAVCIVAVMTLWLMYWSKHGS